MALSKQCTFAPTITTISAFTPYQKLNMEFNTIRKWMQKMNNILEVYAQEDAFTESERNLLLDYNQRIREAIIALNLEEKAPMSHPEAQKPELASPPASALQESVQREAKPGASDGRRFSELFEIKKAEDLSAKLESTPISDIGSALGLGERILIQNTLFNGDRSAMDNVIRKLNSLSTFEQAKEYLCAEVVESFDWMHESRIKNAQVFIKLMKRKYT